MILWLSGKNFINLNIPDAGKALVVDDDGKIVAGEAGGGGGAEYIDAYVTGNETSIKYTIAEIAAMVESGKAVILRQPTNGITILLKLEEMTSNQVIFSSVMMDSEFVYFTNLVFQDLTKPAGEYKAHLVNNYFYEMEYTGNN